MATSHEKMVGRIGSRGDLHRERRDRKVEDGASSGVRGGAQKVMEVGDDGSDRCGICSALVTIRGVLDCCSHVFCFDCIDNWSTVSNHCPLCKLQFRFISVENTHINSSHNGGHQSTPIAVKKEREEEPWGDEEALPFSFPSFFIDEDAVACLEGDRCLIRAGVPLQDEDAADTSVACDSCDRWYHAGCVGFDPSVSWGSWLCPRCSEKAALQQLPCRPSFPPMLPPTTIVPSSGSGQVPVAELAFNATVLPDCDSSVSIATAEEGESALIFSTRRVADNVMLAPLKLEHHQKQPSPTRGLNEQSLLVVKVEDIAYPALEDKALQADGIQEPAPHLVEKVNPKIQNLIKATSLTNSLCPLITLCSPKAEIIGFTGDDFDLGNQRPAEAINAGKAPVIAGKVEQVDLAVGLLEQGEPRANLVESNEGQSRETDPKNREIVYQDLPSSYFGLTDTKAEQENKGKRKQTKQDRDYVRAEDLPEPPRKIARSASKKKEVLQGSARQTPSKEVISSSLKQDTKLTNLEKAPPNVIKASEVVIPFTEGVPIEDLVHIVKDEHIGGNGSNTVGGVRTRVVMRRNTDGRAGQLVKVIRQQMKSAAGYGASDDLGREAVSDDQFFAAFKAALVRTNEQSRGVKAQGLRRRRQSWMAKMLDETPSGKKCGVRESLTKKLYSGGVSRKTWDRDWDISFWKEQSARIKKAKQEASNVVEGRGQRAGERQKDSTVVKNEEDFLFQFKNEDSESDSIMSRLYVADTSLFPRENDIKPLSLLAAQGVGLSNCSVSERGTSGLGGLSKTQTNTPQGSTKVKSSPVCGGLEDCHSHLLISSLQGIKNSSVDTIRKTSNGAVKESDVQETQKVDELGTVKALSTSKILCSPPRSEEKKDKRQWALELLARKSGDAITNSSAKCSMGTKKESSLLVQVPEELRPTLPIDRRSRVPTAIRQLQLNRILEHYLRKAKLASLQGGYKLKSVIAAAVAKELEIYESSNSKGVYVNLCVRALAQQDQAKLQINIPLPSQPGGEIAVQEALLATGLISDSPPGSPCKNDKDSIESGHKASVDEAIVDVPAFLGVTMSTERPNPGEAKDFLELAKPVSGEDYKDLDLHLEEFEPCRSRGGEISSIIPGYVASSAMEDCPSNKLKVVLTTYRSASSSQVTKDNKNHLKETQAGEENTSDAEEINNNLEPGLVETSPVINSERISSQDNKIGGSQLQTPLDEHLGAVKSTILCSDSMEGREGKREKNHENSNSKLRHNQKARNRSNVVKDANKLLSPPGEDQKDSNVTEPKEARVGDKSRFAAISSVGESEGDDWMKSGKFPDLENRIDKMRKDVLEMSPAFLSQFGEENVFGGSLQKHSPSESLQEGGITVKPRVEKPGSTSGRTKNSMPDGPEADAVRQSVQKQVESYIKEHLKPLYKSGVIKSDQFRFAVSKTATKVMQHHADATSADFLILEGSKVKKLADQYLQSFVQKK